MLGRSVAHVCCASGGRERLMTGVQGCGDLPDHRDIYIYILHCVPPPLRALDDEVGYIHITGWLACLPLAGRTC